MIIEYAMNKMRYHAAIEMTQFLCCEIGYECSSINFKMMFKKLHWYPDLRTRFIDAVALSGGFRPTMQFAIATNNVCVLEQLYAQISFITEMVYFTDACRSGNINIVEWMLTHENEIQWKTNFPKKESKIIGQAFNQALRKKLCFLPLSKEIVSVVCTYLSGFKNVGLHNNYPNKICS